MMSAVDLYNGWRLIPEKEARPLIRERCSTCHGSPFGAVVTFYDKSWPSPKAFLVRHWGRETPGGPQIWSTNA